MKRSLILFVTLISAVICNADRISLKNGRVYDGIITKVETNSVTFILSGGTKDNTFSIPVKQIERIVLANGEIITSINGKFSAVPPVINPAILDTINIKPIPAPVPVPAPVVAPKPEPMAVTADSPGKNAELPIQPAAPVKLKDYEKPITAKDLLNLSYNGASDSVTIKKVGFGVLYDFDETFLVINRINGKKYLGFITGLEYSAKNITLPLGVRIMSLLRNYDKANPYFSINLYSKIALSSETKDIPLFIAFELGYDLKINKSTSIFVGFKEKLDIVSLREFETDAVSLTKGIQMGVNGTF